MHVDDRDHVEKASVHRDVRDVDGPHLIAMRDP